MEPKMKKWAAVLAAGFGFASALAAFAGGPFINWASLKNPVLEHQGWSIKDSCMALKDGQFYIFFSNFNYDRGRYRCYVSGVKTRDFRNFSEPLFTWTGEQGGWGGMCSPNLTQIHDSYYLTYNSWGDDKSHPNQLFYAVSRDLENWKKDMPLAANITSGKRVIDAAIAYFNNRYYLVYKEFQTPKMAVSDRLDSADWKSLGTVPGGWFENGEFIMIDNQWHLLVTDENHLPCLRRMQGSGEQDQDWLNWGGFQCLDIPLQKFNTIEQANCAFLADFRAEDGFFYLLYSGRNKGFGHQGDKYFKLALARSKDLKTWKAAGQE